MHLQTLDWIIAAASILVCFVPALFFGKRSGKSTSEFFASGRSAPWWLAGLSMVATTFSSDTPNLVANFVRTQGVAGNWQWWAFTLTGVATVFFYARLWRRSGVLTDLEFYELRYSGNGAKAGGGSYIAQRMLASKSEKDALGATLFFNVAHYVLRPWPWIITGLASLIVYPQLSDIQKAFPRLDPSLLGHDIAFPAMLRFMPAGWIGLMLGGLIAANSSTILTHLNWGASYLVHDFYRRFLNPGKPDHHYVTAGRWCTVLLFFASSGTVFLLVTAQDNFNILLLLGAGTGLLYLLRWFWWRITAWCEIVAMVVSFAVGLVFLVLHKNGMEVHTARELIVGIAITTFCWVLTAYVGPA